MCVQSGAGKQLVLLDSTTRCCVAKERHDFQAGWSPCCELTAPIRDGAVGHDNEERLTILLFEQQRQEGDDLNRSACTAVNQLYRPNPSFRLLGYLLAKAHFVRQDAALLDPPFVVEPVDTQQLKIHQ